MFPTCLNCGLELGREDVSESSITSGDYDAGTVTHRTFYDCDEALGHQINKHIERINTLQARRDALPIDIPT